MANVTFRATIRRVGNSLAVLIPARQAGRLNLRAGQDVETTMEPAEETLLGLAPDLYDGPFRRAPEDRDRESR